MKTEIRLDAMTWKVPDDFYDALLPALGSPDWHGRNLDALNDSLRGDDINQVRLPFRIVIANAAEIPFGLLDYLKEFEALAADLAREMQGQLSLRFEPPLS